ncbi:hypothetical protein [Haliea sp. E17]|uniref:hypothetical protein n=1 Tax=Haliea sp. E17 TaxID=3401576 RepID=UPI003AB086C9
MKKIRHALAMGLCTALLPMTLLAAGPAEGDREFSLSGTGTSDKNFDNNALGFSGDLGWYLSDPLSLGLRQSIVIAEGEGDDFWNGSTRGYVNYHFLSGNARPFVGASLGGVYGEGIKDSSDADDAFDDGAWAYVLGIGFNF